MPLKDSRRSTCVSYESAEAGYNRTAVTIDQPAGACWGISRTHSTTTHHFIMHTAFAKCAIAQQPCSS
jgi:hypothetical protein